MLQDLSEKERYKHLHALIAFKKLGRMRRYFLHTNLVRNSSEFAIMYQSRRLDS